MSWIDNVMRLSITALFPKFIVCLSSESNFSAGYESWIFWSWMSLLGEVAGTRAGTLLSQVTALSSHALCSLPLSYKYKYKYKYNSNKIQMQILCCTLSPLNSTSSSLDRQKCQNCPKQNQNCGTRTRPPPNDRGYKLEMSKLSHHNVQWGWKGDVREWLVEQSLRPLWGFGSQEAVTSFPSQALPNPRTTSHTLPQFMPHINLHPPLIHNHHPFKTSLPVGIAWYILSAS